MEPQVTFSQAQVCHQISALHEHSMQFDYLID